MDYLQEGININDYLQVLKNRKKVIMVFFFTTVFVVTLGSFIMRPVYRATVTLLIDVENPKVLTTTGNVSMGTPDYYAYKEYFQSQNEIIKSRSIAHQVFDGFSLGSTKKYNKSKDPIADFLKTVSTEPVRDTRLLKLNVDNRDPKLAADIANRIAEIYVARNLSYISNSEVINLLKNEHLKLQAKLSEYSKIYKDKHPQMIRLKQEMEQMEERMKIETLAAAGLGETGISDPAIVGVSANNVSIQDRAEVTKIPLRPKKRLNILLSIIVGLFGGIGLAFFFEYMDDTIKGVEDIIHLADWPYLGSIPKINGKGDMPEVQKDLFAHTQPKDPITEAYRSIRTSILFSSTEEHHLRSIIVTSPGPQEGKTTTICNLAITMAHSKKKVLLVDADMRKPRLHEIFNKKNETGLSNFLSEQTGFKELIQKTEIDNLFLVSGGPHPPNPSELISSHKMAEFIDQAKGEFEFILLDTPPIAVVTDASILARAVDGVILVLESEKTSRRALPRVDQLLKEARARLIGVLFNKADISRGGYHYYYGKAK
jgi:capsular exopolysaccharide synthesis family protein